MLYQTWEAFGDYFRPPPLRPELFSEEWHRVGNTPFLISKLG
jgi:hypothetical protein